MVTAERLIAMNGVEGVTLREIQAAAGQSNSSVITYHFGSQAGLVRAVLEFRYRKINARRAELLQQARDRGVSGDPREAVWIIVRPLIESIDAGEMFVPFLARVSANPRTFAEYLPPQTGRQHRQRAAGDGARPACPACPSGPGSAGRCSSTTACSACWPSSRAAISGSARRS